MWRRRSATPSGSSSWCRQSDASGNNSHAGGTTQYDGGLKLGHKNALGTGTYTIGDATTSTTLKVSSTTNLTGANAVGNAVTVAKDFTVDSGSSDLELSGGVALGAVNRTITVDSSNATISRASSPTPAAPAESPRPAPAS